MHKLFIERSIATSLFLFSLASCSERASDRPTTDGGSMSSDSGHADPVDGSSTFDATRPDPQDGGDGGEICGNGLDDDENGQIDDGCACEASANQACFPGNPALAGVGICTRGSQTCAAGEFPGWGACEGAGSPQTEACNGLDDNCDGTADEGCGCAVGTTMGCYATSTGEPGQGSPGVGICALGTATCIANGDGTSSFGPCEGAVFRMTEDCETATDDDCDGMINEGCVNCRGYNVVNATGEAPCNQSLQGAIDNCSSNGGTWSGAVRCTRGGSPSNASLFGATGVCCS